MESVIPRFEVFGKVEDKSISKYLVFNLYVSLRATFSSKWSNYIGGSEIVAKNA